MPCPGFRDFDISENLVGEEEFVHVFGALRKVRARVRRFRLFGMPLLNDGVAALMARYLRECATEEVPSELHLSDCSIGNQGLVAIFEAIAQGAAFREGPPVYVRLERNYIEARVLQGCLDSGFAALTNGAERSSAPLPAATRVCLKAFGGGRGSREKATAAPALVPKAADQGGRKGGATCQVWRPVGPHHR